MLLLPAAKPSSTVHSFLPPPAMPAHDSLMPSLSLQAAVSHPDSAAKLPAHPRLLQSVRSGAAIFPPDFSLSHTQPALFLPNLIL